MFNFIRKLIPLALATALLLPAAAHAETVSIIAGTNQSSQTAISFSSVTLDVTANQSLQWNYRSR
ncbi:hypothetical protein [Paenibacillus glucanolyticus]|uniref:hypothetical protein n=1 Tax=Paenibacillus glucanolyticus TaxID=59843 RepID=UPI00128DDE59|nr:hypothetical protein [Paenibacillus glucanolyticus]MPY19094.1 hypothetical protein [Paenibacillus glucanolyticus]